jgi:hypothetical protein
VILWQGPSEIDGTPIVLIATGLDGKSGNPKTGPMAQTWILRRDMSPHKALATGEDKSICGGCRHRPRHRSGERYSGRSCYVNAIGLESVYRAYTDGMYGTMADPNRLVGTRMRIGSYGDPAAVPASLWGELVPHLLAWTAYTHQWKSDKFDGLRWFCMASVDTPEEEAQARARGWGTFRVMARHEEKQRHEAICPASDDAGHLTTCFNCLRCSGPGGGHVALWAHGAGKVHFRSPQLALPVLR